MKKEIRVSKGRAYLHLEGKYMGVNTVKILPLGTSKKLIESLVALGYKVKFL